MTSSVDSLPYAARRAARIILPALEEEERDTWVGVVWRQVEEGVWDEITARSLALNMGWPVDPPVRRPTTNEILRAQGPDAYWRERKARTEALQPLGIRSRVLSWLVQGPVASIDDLMALSDDEILAIRGIGVAKFAEVKAALQAYSESQPAVARTPAR